MQKLSVKSAGWCGTVARDTMVISQNIRDKQSKALLPADYFYLVQSETAVSQKFNTWQILCSPTQHSCCTNAPAFSSFYAVRIAPAVRSEF